MQGFQGLDAGGFEDGNEAGEQAGGDEDGDGPGEGSGVDGLNSEQEAFQQAGGEEGERDSSGDSDDDQYDAFAEEEPGDVYLLRSDGEADSDFAGAAGDGVSDEAVDSEAAQSVASPLKRAERKPRTRSEEMVWSICSCSSWMA